MEELKKQTLKDVLERSVKLFEENVAMTKIDGDPVTYAEFSERVRNVSLFLRGQDISKGDRVAILSENQVNWGIAFFSITSMGAIAVPILPDFHADAVHHILRHAECKALFVSKRLYEKIEEVKSEKLKNIILIDDFHLVLEKAKKDRLGEVVKEITKLTESALRKTGKKHTPAKIDEDDIASIIYTSGTTGHSKGVMLTHKNIVWNAQAVINMVDLTDKERFLSILPLSHTMECTIGLVIPIMKGCCVYYLDKPPTPKLLMTAMTEVKPTVMISVPLIIEKIFKTRILPKLIGNSLSRGLYKLSPVRRKLHKLAGKKLMESFGGELRYFPIGGAAIAPDVERFMKEADFPYVIGYGLTETSPLLAGTPPDNKKLRSTGPPLEGVEIIIDNPNPDTGEGEIVARGPSVMKGYYKDPERTAEVLSEDGWFRTGDLGVFDEEGHLYIKGRSKNVIVGPSGENIYPEEIEGVLNQFEYVMESLVYQHEGQLVARIHPNYEWLDMELNGSTKSDTKIEASLNELLEDLRKQANEKVSGFSRISKIIEQTEPFEKTPTQKIKRYLYVE